jgi:succinyl-diaminopimelate desuccinylase
LDFIEACRKFVELDSTPANGTAELGAYAAELCRQAGLHVDAHAETHNGVEQMNVIARPSSERPKEELLLQTHLDTADPGSYALWTKTGSNPFNASIYTDSVTGQEVLYGLGSADSKLDFVCKLKAISELPKRRYKMPFVLAGTFGEELGMPGAIKLIRKKLVSSTMALIGEPTDMHLVHTGKGFAAVEIEIPFSQAEKDFRAQHNLGDGVTTQSRVFIGKAAHSSAPQTGESAIEKMLDYLSKLPDGLAVMEIEGGISANTVPAQAVLEIDMVGGLVDTMCSKISRITQAIGGVEKKFQNFKDAEFDPPSPTLNIGFIRTYEDFVKFGGCVRLPPTVTHEVYEEWMEDLRSACVSVGAFFRITEYKQPFRTVLHAPLLEICSKELSRLGLPSRSGAQSVTTEANVFSRFGISCVVIGPGEGVGNSHAPNEKVRIEQLHQAVQFYRGVLERQCL